MLPIEVHQNQIPQAFERFSEIIGEKVWFDQVDCMNAEIARNPLLNDYLSSQNALVILLKTCTLASAKNAGKLPWELTSQSQFVEAYVFITQILALFDAAKKVSNKRARILVHRVRDVLKYPTAIHAMQLENRVATHFLNRGHSVRFPELGSSSETFDLLIESLGPSGLEIECKSLTHDKGIKIHRQDALEFFHMMLPSVANHSRNLTSSLAIVVTIPARLPNFAELGDLVKSVNQQILVGMSGELQDGTHVRFIDFLTSELGPLANPPSIENKTAFEKITGTTNRECVFYRATETSGLVGLVLQSTQPDSMLHEVFVTIAESAAKQLTGKRAGALIGTFQGLRSSALLDIAMKEGSDANHSSLAQRSRDLLSRGSYPHLVGVGFLSAPEIFEFERAESANGSTYFFPETKSAFWHSDFSGLFGVDPRLEQLRAM